MDAQRPSHAPRFSADWKQSPVYNAWQNFWIPIKILAAIALLLLCVFLALNGGWNGLRIVMQR